ncbi:MAG: MraY family glycosyltransferase [SAR86 cluster bacterium]
MTTAETKVHEDLNTGLSGWPLLIVSAAIGGVAGVLSVGVARWLTRHGGLDSPDKHGISSVRACRLGGVLITSYVLFSIIYHYILDGELIFWGESLWVLGLSAGFFAIGLFEDIKGILSARLRLVLMLGAVAVLMGLDDNLLIKPVGLPMFDWLLASLWLAVPITLLCLAFLPNAFNAADGANGLVAGTSLIILIALADADLGALNLLLNIVAVSCVIFLAYNLVTAKVYLGDGGAYFLGALGGGAMIAASNARELPVWYLLSLIFYPTADFLWSISRRIYGGQSPLAADELHLHNLVYGRIRRVTGWPIAANTMTGLGIALAFTGVPYFIWWMNADAAFELAWEWLYLLQSLVYLSLWLSLRPKPSSEGGEGGDRS